MSEPSSSPALHQDADKLAARLRNGHAVLFQAQNPPRDLGAGIVLMIDPLVRPVRAGDVVLLLEPTLHVARVQKVRAHQLWIVGQLEPVAIEYAVGVARTPPLSLWQRLRAWAAR